MRSENLRYGLFPLFDVRGLVVEELVDDLDQGFGVGDVFVGDAGPGLVEHGALGGLEFDVVAGIAFFELALDFACRDRLFRLWLPSSHGRGGRDRRGLRQR